ncbi:aromatic acid exporter family protein [Halobacillus shinanisalinarum]|uniref:Aromatic acid exporter family protein n=1 Tax=Halobacillus shinanisalinarum TaxID=2932258 RepID=A0ABY4H045_9BACI|nr:aromatic acid exporter family protein [Halobacillus shinanisalinarum]UOQ93032.1 aromatic acid exporter family protein [Halobacillus shinanisalinarum]
MLNFFKGFYLLGGRTIKTGISVFLTALICGFFNFPIIFAVITAIVTIEHTAADSIKKAMIRFPASAIGALSATGFYALFGKGALTFALAAMVTIAVCHKLKLDDGILVATITATAMIPDFQDDYFVSFITRLGTTSIGIVISTLVNFFLLPPNYSPRIYKNINQLFVHASQLIIRIISNDKGESNVKNRRISGAYRELTVQLERTFQLVQFQREEWKYHRHTIEQMKDFQFAQKKLGALQQITYHIGNLQYVRFMPNDFSPEEKQILNEVVQSLAKVMKDPAHKIDKVHLQKVEKLDHLFWKWKELHVEHSNHNKHQLPPQTILMYELLCFHEVLEELEKISAAHMKTVTQYYSE